MVRKKRYALTRNFFEFGEYLKEKRVAADLTQKEVAEKIGYSSAQYISNFERGIALPPLSKLKMKPRRRWSSVKIPAPRGNAFSKLRS